MTTMLDPACPAASAPETRVLRFSRRTAIDVPPAVVWSIIADYGRDPQWRRGVTAMQPHPAGLVRPGTTTGEILRLGGRTYRSGGLVTEVDEGRRFAWHTTSGVSARGWRAVRPIPAGGAEVELHLEVHLHGLQVLMKPLLKRMLATNLAADVERLRELALAERRRGHGRGLSQPRRSSRQQSPIALTNAAARSR